ncbi:hypothetical protein Tco_1345112 [Tanacetum coccineum]
MGIAHLENVCQKNNTILLLLCQNNQCAKSIIQPPISPYGMFLDSTLSTHHRTDPHLDNIIYDIVDSSHGPLALNKLGDLEVIGQGPFIPSHPHLLIITARLSFNHDDDDDR